jgi:hypothetical protein
MDDGLSVAGEENTIGEYAGGASGSLPILEGAQQQQQQKHWNNRRS